MTLTFASSEGKHGRLALTGRASRYHQHFVEAGWLQLCQTELIFTSWDSHGVPAPRHADTVVQLLEGKRAIGKKEMTGRKPFHSNLIKARSHSVPAEFWEVITILNMRRNISSYSETEADLQQGLRNSPYKDSQLLTTNLGPPVSYLVSLSLSPLLAMETILLPYWPNGRIQ